MSVISNNQLAGAAGQGGSGYKIDNSLRFNSGDSAHLKRTFGSGDRKTWTLSFWVKGAYNTTTDNRPLMTYGTASNSDYLDIKFTTAGNLQMSTYSTYYINTTAVFRDSSAWYHIVIAVDTTQSTAADRVKLYVNGVETARGGSDPTEDQEFGINNNQLHVIGAYANASGGSLAGSNFYLADYHFVDGQRLAATDFGEFDANNVWQPIETNITRLSATGPNKTQDWDSQWTGTGYGSGYSTDHVHDTSILAVGGNTHSSNCALPANNSSLVFTPSTAITVNTSVVLRGADGGGAGADKLWVINEGRSDEVAFYQKPSGSGVQDMTATSSQVGGAIHSITLYGRGSGGGNSAYLAAIFVDGRHLQTGGPTADSINDFHLKFDDTSSNSAVGTDDAGSNDWTVSNITVGTENVYENDVTVQISSVTQGAGGSSNPDHMFDGDKDYYCYANSNDSTNYILWEPTGGYTTPGYIWIQGGDGNGNGADDCTVQINGSTVSPTDNVDNETYSSSSYQWGRWWKYPVSGNTLTSLKLIQSYALIRQLSTVADPSFSALSISSDSDVPTINSVYGKNLDNFIDSPTDYVASSGNNGGNYCTWNPLNKNSNSTLSNGNLLASSSAVHTVLGTIAFPDSGKYYAEFTVTAINSGYPVIGILANNDSGITANQNPNTGVSYFQGGSVSLNGTSTGTTLTAMSAGDTVGVAYDAATRKVWFSLNGTFLNSGNPAAGTNEITTLTENSSGYSWACCPYSTATVTLNAGQRSFKYTPPSGYKSLCTANLPDPTIEDPSTVFDVALWTANGSSQAIGGLNFSPDLVWAKSRNTGTTPHLLVDSVRGVNKVLSTHSTAAEEDYSGISGVISAFNSDGFDTGGNSDIATNNRTFVAWCWDAGSSNTSVSAGGLNSSAYDQSEDWSGGSVSGAVHSSVTWEDAFDGALGTGVFTYATNTSTLTMPSGTTWSNKFEVYALKHGGTLYVNGTDVGTSMSGFTSTAQWHDITSIVGSSGTLSSIGVSDVSTNYVKLFAVRLDGKLLVDSGESPTNVPSIASTYRANPSSGFSIVKFTNGNGTVAHGLNSPPELIITKDISNTYTWGTYSKTLTKDAYIAINSENGSSSVAGMWGSAEPTSLEFGTSSYVAGTGNELIAYCFSSVKDYSSIGSYTGNGSTDGPFVYTGFRPKWLLLKHSTDAYHWYLFDSSRDTNNVVGTALIPNESYAETNDTTTYGVDFVSNGFKLRNSNVRSNNSGNTFIYAAFAEHPFKTARAR